MPERRTPPGPGVVQRAARLAAGGPGSVGLVFADVDRLKGVNDRSGHDAGDRMLRAIARKRVTILLGVPTLFHAINQCPEIKRYDLSSLKICISGGDSLPRAVQRKFVELTGKRAFSASAVKCECWWRTPTTRP